MKAYLEIEIFGDNIRQEMKLYASITNMIVSGLGDSTFGKMPSSGWVAEIIGFDAKFKYTRQFLKSKKDYSRANSVGSRGIFQEYILESDKIYEVKKQISQKNNLRYFCKVDNEGNIITIQENEVIEWLKNLSA